MKTATVVIITKGMCVVVEGAAIGLTAGLAQWATGGDRPSDIAWIVIISAAVLNAASKLGNFLSTSFSQYLKDGQQNNATAAGQQKP